MLTVHLLSPSTMLNVPFPFTAYSCRDSNKKLKLNPLHFFNLSSHFSGTSRNYHWSLAAFKTNYKVFLVSFERKLLCTESLAVFKRTIVCVMPCHGFSTKYIPFKYLMGKIMAFVVVGTHDHLLLSAMSRFYDINPWHAESC